MNDHQKFLSSWVPALTIFAVLFSGSSPGLAVPLLGSELASFAVLGSSTVTNTGPTALTGNLGVSPGSAITGFFGTVENDGPGTFTGTSHQGNAFANTAQVQLTAARTSLGLMGTGTLLASDLTLAGTLFPGVYSFAGGAATLSGAVTLDGQGNANAAWVFQIASTLITSSGSAVNVINTGSGAGLYWNVGSSATLDTTTSFQGNILALTSISLLNGATIGCGRALADDAAVTMIANTIGIGCDSNGFSGGLTVDESGLPTALAFAAAVPLPGTLPLFAAGLGMLGLLGWRRNRNASKSVA